MDKRDDKVAKTTRWEENFLEVLMGHVTHYGSHFNGIFYI
jgi:sensor domain CHASE-containing protein